MPQFEDEDGNVFEVQVDAQGNPILETAMPVGMGPQTIGTPDPTAHLAGPTAAVDLTNKSAQRGDRAFDEAQKLRSEFQKQPSVIAYNVALGTFSSSLKTANNAQGDQSLITAYAKMLDPTSAVREGEFATTANTQNMVSQIKAKIAKEFGGADGGMLTNEGRNAVRNEMRNLVLNRFQIPYDRDRTQYERLASSYGLEPYQVVGEPALSNFPEGMLEPQVPQGGKAFTEAQERLYNATMAANPNATADQLRAIFDAANLPEIENLEEVVAARNQGGPVVPGSAARLSGNEPNGTYQESQLGQGMAGVNEGIAGTLGFPVDAATWAMNLVPKGINAAANANIPEIQNPVLGSDWINDRLTDVGAIYPENTDGEGSFSRRVGQSIGGAAIPAAALARTGGQLGGAMLSAAGGGVGGASAQKVFPDNPLAELAGETLGSAVSAGSLLANAKRRAQAAIENKVPTVDQLKEQAGDLYQTAESRGVTASPQQTQQYADDMAKMLRDEGQLGPNGRITDADTSSTKAFNLVNQYAGQPMRPKEMNTVRKVIADGRKSTDQSDLRITGKLLDQHDEFATPLAPEFGKARDVSSRYLQAEDLEQAKELAGARAGQFSGSGYENALRTEYRALDRNNIKGKNFFNDDTMKAIETVSRGTPVSNTARNIGRFAPTGVLSTGLTSGGGAALGMLAGGPVGGMFGAGLASGIGHGGRALATKMGTRAANIAELTARNGGKLPEARLVDLPELLSIGGASSGQLAQFVDVNGDDLAEDENYSHRYGNGHPNPKPLPRRVHRPMFGAAQ